MTLIDCFNQFWKINSEASFTPSEAYLYFYLLSVWNRSGRIEKFECSTSDIIRELGITKPTLVDCRKRLQKKGLIRFKEGNRKVINPYYELVYFTNDFTNDFTNHLTNDFTNPKEKVSPAPPLKENITEFREKESISNEIPKKAELPDEEIINGKTKERMNWKSFMQTFNDMIPPPIPRVTSMNESRRKKVKAIVKEYGKPTILKVFEKVRNSDYLMGRKKKPGDTWNCNFDFIFSPSGFIKILEGNYDNGESNHQAHGQLCVNSGAVQDQSINIYKEVFGYDGAPEEFEEWFNKRPYGS